MKLLHTLTLLMAAMLCGCQNDGPIGDWFGVWRIDTYTTDGRQSDDPLVYETCIAFQGDVVEVTAEYDGHQSFYTCYGTWAEDPEGRTLTLDFTHHDDTHAPGTAYYTAPWWLGWTSERPVVLTVTDRTSRRMTLTETAGDGTVNVFKISKTW